MSKKNRFRFCQRIYQRWVQIKWLCFTLGLVILTNFLTQIIRKPTEVLSILPTHSKTIDQTWKAYRRNFIQSSTSIITADLLAAIAQVESAGNPLAQPQWTFRWTSNIFKIYSPQSTAVGLMQITEGHYQEAKKYCVRQGQVKMVGRWYELDSCWWNSLYARFFPAHSIEMASAYMHIYVERLLGMTKIKTTSRENLQKLAIVIHLCGKNRAAEFVASGFRFKTFHRCGSHSAPEYLEKVFRLKSQFARLWASGL